MGLNGDKVKCPTCGRFVAGRRATPNRPPPEDGARGPAPKFWKPEPSEPPASIEESKRWLAKYKKEVLDAR